MAADKLSIINDELVLTGNDVVNVADDGSVEWLVGSAAYESAVEHLLNEHDWKFGTGFAVLTRVDDDTEDAVFTEAFAKPNGALHVTSVTIDGVPSDYRIVGNRIWLSAGDGEVRARYISEPGPENWPGLFLKALRCKVRAGIYRGINEDPAEARVLEAESEEYLRRARTRSDQEQPKRAIMVSTAREARRRRRG